MGPATRLATCGASHLLAAITEVAPTKLGDSSAAHDDEHDEHHDDCAGEEVILALASKPLMISYNTKFVSRMKSRSSRLAENERSEIIVKRVI